MTITNTNINSTNTIATIQSIVVDSTFESATITDSNGVESTIRFESDSSLIKKCDKLESVINTDSTSFELDTDTLSLLDSVTVVIVLNSMIKSGIDAVNKIIATAKKTGNVKKVSVIKTFDSLMNNLVNLDINSDTDIDTISILSPKKALSWYKSNNCTNKTVKVKDKKTGKTVEKEIYKGTELELARKYHNHLSSIESTVVVTALESVLTQLLESVKTDSLLESVKNAVVSEIKKSASAVDDAMMIEFKKLLIDNNIKAVELFELNADSTDIILKSVESGIDSKILKKYQELSTSKQLEIIRYVKSLVMKTDGKVEV